MNEETEASAYVKSGFSNKSTASPVLSECRDLVIVPGGLSAQIQALEEQFPEFCWRYPASELIISSQMNTACFHDPDPRVPKALRLFSDLAVTDFFAYISYASSPVDFYAQPKALDPARLRFDALLNQVYEDDMEPAREDQLFLGLPCAVRAKADGHWYRARVDAIPKVSGSVHICFVDWGGGQFVDDLRELKPLLSRFGRLPPLALHCKIHGISINDLETERVEEFQQTLTELGHAARVRLVSGKTSPFLVDLLHPTLATENLGERYRPRKKPPPPPQPLLHSEDEDYFSSSDEERPPTPPHLIRYNRLHRPPNYVEKVWVSYVADARAIILQEGPHRDRVRRLTARLAESYATPPPSMSLEQMEEGMACAVVESGGCWRGLVRQTAEDGVWVQAVDHGQIHHFTASRLASLKPLFSEFSDEPLMWHCRLGGACDEDPIPEETELLRYLLPPGSEFRAAFERGRGPPWRVELTNPAGENVLEAFQQEVEKRLIRRSKAVVPFYPPSAGIQIRSDLVQLKEYEPYFPCCLSFKKGCLSLGTLAKDAAM